MEKNSRGLLMAIVMALPDLIASAKVNGIWRVAQLRADEWGFSPGTLIGTLVGVLIAVIIGFALLGTLLSSVAAVNKTSSYAAGSQIPALINLAPLLFVLGIVIAAIAVVFVALKMGLGEG